jgi:hypothetical protein
MKRKLILAVLLVALPLLVTLAIPDRSEADTCSGDYCGCYLLYEPCAEWCPAEPLAEHRECIMECVRAVKRCSIACCSY